MKVDEMIKICAQMQVILEPFAGMELTVALVHVHKAVAEYQVGRERTPPKRQTSETLPTKEELQVLAKMPPTDLLHHLQTSSFYKTKAKLIPLAKAIGIRNARSHTKDTLLNMIVKSFQLKRMDTVLQTERSFEESI